MKQAILLLLGLAPGFLFAQVIYSENFDTMAVGTRIAAADTVHWTTWGHLPGSTQDVPVTDAHSHSPDHSLAVIQQSPGSVGGPSDPVLLLGYHISGTYSLSWSMFVPHERGAEIVFYHEDDIPSTDPAALIDFLPFYDVDSMDCYVNGARIRRGYPRATWFTASFIFNLDASTATFRINDMEMATWAFNTTPSGDPANNVLGLVRMKATTGYNGFLGEYYIDDILFQEGTVGIHELEAARPLTIAPNPTANATVLSMDVPASNAQVEVHDANGRVVWQAAWPAGAEQYDLPAGALAPGAYVVRVSRSAGSAMRDPAWTPGTPVYTGRLVVMP